MDMLLAPINMMFRLVGTYPIPVMVACVAGTIAGWLTGHDVVSVSFALYGSTVMIWYDEHTRPRAIDDGVVAGD